MNRNSPASQVFNNLESAQLSGFARSIAELHWLLLILVLLYYFLPTGPLEAPDGLVVTMVGYAGFVLLFRYARSHTRETRLKLAAETWGMIVFITIALMHTGYQQSPLLNLYLLVIIVCAITLGKMMTLLEVVLIACCYLLACYTRYSTDLFAPATLSALLARFSPFLMVAYVTSMLASDIISARRRMAELAQTDELTGLLNLRAFDLLLERELERARHYRDPFIVLMVELDDLRGIRDRYGSSTGMRLIRAIAGTLRNSVRANDTVARYSGDEFAVLMRLGSNVLAGQHAERIRAAISNTSIEVNGSRVSVTASIGIAAYPDTVDDPDRVFELADRALRCSKQVGRNQVTWYDHALDALPGNVSHHHQTTRQYA
jgi:diguanylate cyclase (GGDEF)-like protein